jgi:pimeloyl-ACP methyl ester carboxylesterase
MTARLGIHWRDRPVEVEVELIDAKRTDRPLLVFVHEGLGSVSMWRDFPRLLCEQAGVRGLVYSRPGYGRSTPRTKDERWTNDFMHRQADEVLPAVLDGLGLDEPAWVLGHSDGGSIALLFAALHPARVRGLVLLAPHIFTEDMGVANIRAAREAYLSGDLRTRLSRHHDDVDSAFWGWNDVWLDPAFRVWNIEREIASIGCPTLAIQGLQDEYGTLDQIHGIARRVPAARLLELDHCGHSPHRDQPQAVCEAVSDFIHNNSRRQAP